MDSNAEEIKRTTAIELAIACSITVAVFSFVSEEAVFGMMLLLTAYGLWVLKPWGYRLAVVMFSWSVLSSVADLIPNPAHYGNHNIITPIILISVSSLALICLRGKEETALYSSPFSWLPKFSECWHWYIIFAMAIAFWTEGNYHKVLPVLELEQLDKRTGIVESVYNVGRAQSPRLKLRQGNQDFFYNLVSHDNFVMFESLKGKEVTIWSQKEFHFIRFGYNHYVQQVKVENKLVLDYEKSVKPRKMAIKAGELPNGDVVYYLFSIFLISVSVIGLIRHSLKSSEE